MDSSNNSSLDRVQVTWKPDGSINEIAYGSRQLVEEFLRCLPIVDWQAIRELVQQLLDAVAALSPEDKWKKIVLADSIFEQFKRFEEFLAGSYPPNPKLQFWFWNNLVRQVWEWEGSHEPVHKGTAYFWAAASCLSAGDIHSAYIFFFNSLEDAKRSFEPIKKSIKHTPSYRTTSLIDNKDNALYPDVVAKLRSYLKSFADGYNHRTGSNLSMNALDQRFLQFDDLENTKRLFVATLHELYHLDNLNSTQMISNDYSRLWAISKFFDIGLIVDQVLEYRFLRNKPQQERTMGNAVYRFALHSGFPPAKGDECGKFFKDVIPKLWEPPDQVVPILLARKVTYKGLALDSKNCAVLTSYHLRNYGAHHLEQSNILVSRYHDILDTMMDALFASIELL